MQSYLESDNEYVCEEVSLLLETQSSMGKLTKANSNMKNKGRKTKKTKQKTRKDKVPA